jgi:hypothetical protein
MWGSFLKEAPPRPLKNLLKKGKGSPLPLFSFDFPRDFTNSTNCDTIFLQRLRTSLQGAGRVFIDTPMMQSKGWRSYEKNKGCSDRHERKQPRKRDLAEHVEAKGHF